MKFQDYFSKQAAIYSKARPTYPRELFQYLANIAPSNERCWDCATGNGQAAISLSENFKQVIATDGSEMQIINAARRANIEYHVATAEQSGLDNASIDLITVATAAHWFNLDLFYTEAQRVAKANGILAVWTYSEAKISPEIDAIVEWFMYTYLKDYWPDGRWFVRNKYQTLPFPFKIIETPAFECKVEWNRAQWLNYVMSWSAYTNYEQKKNNSPLPELELALEKYWNAAETKNIQWPLHLKCTKLNVSK